MTLVVTLLFHKDEYKKISILIGILTLAAMPLAFTKVISLLAAEWVSLSVIGVHFILSTMDMDQPVSIKKPKPLV